MLRTPFAAAFLLMSVALPAAAENITREDWGTTAKGEKVDIYTLKGQGGVSARITNFGAVIVNLYVPDKKGDKADIVLGYDDLASYEKGGVYSAIIGRVVNRIGSNATFTLEGKKYQIEHPEGQQWVLHSGPNGFQKRVWTATPHDGAEPSLTLTLKSPDGDTGFPGALTATVTYTLMKDNSLKLDYRATTDAPTVVNLTNHAYFNLAGEGSGDVLDDKVQVFADYFTPADQISIPTGEIRSVAGTPLDFRAPVRVGDTVDSSYDQIATYKGYNINFVIRGKPGTLRPAAKFFDTKSGRVMEVFTTQPGMQLFSDNIVGTITGKGGKIYGNRYSMSFETQHYPDSPNHPMFPSEEITPSHPLHEVTVFKFTNP